MREALTVARVVTLTGVGGVGKTRVAARAAAQLGRSFPDGTWLVDLADVRDPELAVPAVTGVFGLCERDGRPLPATLTAFLRPARLLLVLDGCGHLRAELAAFLDTLLRDCPEVRLLATSREPLGLDGERVLRVPPLGLRDEPDPRGPHLPARSEAVSLFVDRATAAVPSFRLDEGNQAAVGEICRCLDGLPLAIELAAARLRALSVNQILEWLEDRRPSRPAAVRAGPERPQRPQPPQAPIEWSYDLCSPAEQLLWARLAVFAGGFEVDAVQGICTDAALPAAAAARLLADLGEKSVLVRQEYRFGTRYRMPEPIREFAAAKLRESGEHAILALRHREWYGQLVLRVDGDWVGPRQEYWLARMRHEHPNLRAAFDHGLTHPGGSDSALEILVVPWRVFWWAYGLVGEGRRSTSRALAVGSGQPALLARAHALASHLAVFQADYATGHAHMVESLALARASGDPAALSFAHFAAGMHALRTGDLPGAIDALEEGLGAATSLPQLNWQLDLLLPMASSYSSLGKNDAAVTYLERLLALAELRGESFQRSYALLALGLVLWQQGDLSRAAQLERASMRLKAALDDLLGVVLCLEVLVYIAVGRGQHERAATLLGAARTLWHCTGSAPSAFPNLDVFHEESERRARVALGDADFGAAVIRGLGLSTEEAIAYALEEEPAPVLLPQLALPLGPRSS